MKNSILIFAVLLLLSQTVAGQPYFVFYPANSNTTNNLTSVSADSRIAVGTNGTILVSTNAGVNWQSVPSPISGVDFRCISNAIPNNYTRFFAVGTNHAIIYSSNSGFNWISITNNITVDLNGVASGLTLNPTVIKAVVVGNSGKVYVSTFQGGTNWSSFVEKQSGTTQDLFCVAMIGRNVWIGGAGSILKSTDMGDTFFSLTNSPAGVKSMYFVDSLIGIAVTSQQVWRTTNGGNLWTLILSTQNYVYNHCTSGFITGNSIMLISKDRGASWVYLQSGYPQVNYLSSSIIDSLGVVVGAGGTILRRAVDTTFNSSIRTLLEGNNIQAFFQTTGIFDQNTTNGNAAGFTWPANSGKTAVFTTGLSTFARVNNQLRMFACSYHGELVAGYITDSVGVPVARSDFRFKTYRVRRSDGPGYYDWYNWGYMVPYGAPYVDVNHNGIYEPLIDTPGVKNAEQTVFICMTDGFPHSHTGGEGFGGGTAPLMAEVHLTAWSYSFSPLEDVQFIKYEILNKGQYQWNNVFFTIFCDPDIGNAVDDYLGVDSLRRLTYAYNATNYDLMYGTAPPAFGIKLLRGPVLNNSYLPLTSSVYSGCYGCVPTCESDPNGEPEGAYFFAQGVKKDSTPWVIPGVWPRQTTGLVYSGDPETNSGWTEAKGCIKNCGGSLYGDSVGINPPHDVRFIMNTGGLNLHIPPGGKRVLYYAQLIKGGVNNLNSVTVLKNYADVVQNFFDGGMNMLFHISGLVKYRDNSQPVSQGYVKALKFDRYSGNILTLDSVGINSDGTYDLANVPQDSVFIGAYPNSSQTQDFIITYYPSTMYWQQATRLYPTSNQTNINISVERVYNTVAQNSINGRVFKYADGGLSGVNIYAKFNDLFVRCTSGDSLGIYHLLSLPVGGIKVIVDRIGYKPDSAIVNVNSNSQIDSINFYLAPVYVGIKYEGNNIPLTPILYQNYPNPFNATTSIKYAIHKDGYVKIVIYDLLGREVKILVNESMRAGTYTVQFNVSELASGVYFYRMSFENFSDVKKMILVK
ncbi:MAG: T9SS type A sorting domain-containing protein [Ignavibacteria bacterium]